MSVAINGTDGITYNDGSVQASAPIGKNLIINGNMQIAQRGTSATGLGITSGYYTCDRYKYASNGSPTFQFTQTQDTDAPSGQGFANSIKMDCTTAQASLGTSDHLYIETRFEGQNLQHLKKGTSNAESVTLSFWVKSNKTGTYSVTVFDFDNTRQIASTYTIDTANTWEKKTLTFVGDITGTLDNDNAGSIGIYWSLGLGTNRTDGTLQTTWGSYVEGNWGSSSQVNLADSTSNYINITGVQLEVGEGASDFEFLPYDVQLARCQRYFEPIINDSLGYNIGQIVGSSFNTTRNFTLIYMKQIKRAIPTIAASGVGGSLFQNNVAKTVTALNFSYPNYYSVGLDLTASVTQGDTFHYDPSATTVITADAEL
jgi:hypothetical protein